MLTCSKSPSKAGLGPATSPRDKSGRERNMKYLTKCVLFEEFAWCKITSGGGGEAFRHARRVDITRNC